MILSYLEDHFYGWSLLLNAHNVVSRINIVCVNNGTIQYDCFKIQVNEIIH